MRQLPALDEENKAFWTGGERGELMIVRCSGCEHYIHPPRPRCHLCGSSAVAPVPVSGRGKVKSFTINAQAWMPGLKIPYVVAAVELDEQERLYVFSNIVGCPVQDVRSGMPVEVEFENIEDVWIPLFHPVERVA
ncbi:DNA-binding protein [Novosphingobium pentaromativorans US6-1]|nr:DNA-binding protein [Novosphingobium pentaromativorans US6-1]